MKFSPWEKREDAGCHYFTADAGRYTGYTSVDISDETVRKLAEAKLSRIRQAVKKELPGQRHVRMDIVVGPPPGGGPSSPIWLYSIFDCALRCLVFLKTILEGLIPAYGDTAASHTGVWLSMGRSFSDS